MLQSDTQKALCSQKQRDLSDWSGCVANWGLGQELNRSTDSRLGINEFARELARARTPEIVEPIIISLAREAGEQLAKIVGGNTLDHFMKGFPMWTREDALQVQLLEQKPKKIFFNVTRCRYAEMYQELGIRDLGFLFSCNRDGALIQGLNPNIKFTRTQTIMQGPLFVISGTR